MRADRKYRNIEELYRAKLGEREYPVSDRFWADFSGKLSHREFLRFRPGSFNVYYLAGLIAAVSITVAVLVSNNDSKRPSPQAPAEIITTDSLTSPLEALKVQDELPPESLSGNEDTKTVVSKAGKGSKEVRETEGKITPADEGAGIKTVREPGKKISALTTGDIIIPKTVTEPAPFVDFTPLVSKGCAPVNIYFENLSLNYDSCLWEFDDGGISTEKDPVWVYDEAGDYEVKLVLFGKDGTRVSKRGKVTVYSSPEARFEVSEGNPAIPDEEVRFYNYSQNAVKWEWDFGDGTGSQEFEPSHFYNKPASYTVTLKAISEYGCVDSMVITNAFGKNSCYINFPNAFVPNQGGPTGGYYSARSDQQEEVFHPVFSGVTSYNLRIFSRRGLLVFESGDIEIGWDGYYKGQMAEPGVYIWKARGTFKNGESFVKGGDVTLLPKW